MAFHHTTVSYAMLLFAKVRLHDSTGIRQTTCLGRGFAALLVASLFILMICSNFGWVTFADMLLGLMAFHPHHITSNYASVRNHSRMMVLIHADPPLVSIGPQSYVVDAVSPSHFGRWQRVCWRMLVVCLNDAGNHQAEQRREFHAQPRCAVAGSLLGVRLCSNNCSEDPQDESYQNLHPSCSCSSFYLPSHMKSTENNNFSILVSHVFLDIVLSHRLLGFGTRN